MEILFLLNEMNLFRPKPDYAAIQAAVHAELAADPINNDALFSQWCDGPGKNYPTHVEMLRDTEVSPLRPCMMWNAGWDAAYREWARQQLK